MPRRPRGRSGEQAHVLGKHAHVMSNILLRQACLHVLAGWASIPTYKASMPTARIDGLGEHALYIRQACLHVLAGWASIPTYKASMPTARIDGLGEHALYIRQACLCVVWVGGESMLMPMCPYKLGG